MSKEVDKEVFSMKQAIEKAISIVLKSKMSSNGSVDLWFTVEDQDLLVQVRRPTPFDIKRRDHSKIVKNRYSQDEKA